MTPVRSAPLVIVTLPGRTVTEARRQAADAAAHGAGAAEVRLDRWTDSERSRLGDLFPSALPLVATLRSRAEGGEAPDTTDERAPWLSLIRGHPFVWIDLEHARDPVPGGAVGEGPRPIVSKHLRPGEAGETLESFLDTASPPGGFLKAVVPASIEEALQVVLPAVAAHPPTGLRAVMTTGPSGPLLRAWASEVGSCAVYCSLGVGAADPALEPTQIPVDRYLRWAQHPGGASLFAVLGSPIAHSRSPDLHECWMREEKRAGLFVALECGANADLARIVPALAARGVRGLSVTHPLKAAAFSIATRRSPAAELTGCANTLVLSGTEILAENSDLPAVQRRMEELRAGYPGILRHVLVVGSGGAARATLAAARDLGVRPEILAREKDRAAELARGFGAEVAEDPPGGTATLLVQATTVGRADSPSYQVSIEPWIDTRTYVLDFVYDADHPTTSEMAGRRGARYEDGRRLLAYAAAASYAAWWGTAPSPTLVEQALRELP